MKMFCCCWCFLYKVFSPSKVSDKFELVPLKRSKLFSVVSYFTTHCFVWTGGAKADKNWPVCIKNPILKSHLHQVGSESHTSTAAVTGCINVTSDRMRNRWFSYKCDRSCLFGEGVLFWWQEVVRDILLSVTDLSVSIQTSWSFHQRVCCSVSP